MDDLIYSDAARRASEMVNVLIARDRELALHCWVAIRLSDGGSDGVLYEHRHDAVAHQLHETQCFYLKIQPGFTPKIAERFLAIHRQVYDAGMRMADTDEDQELVIPMRLEEIFR